MAEEIKVSEEAVSQEPSHIFKKLDPSIVIIGLTGSLGSGCSYVADSIMKVAPTGTYKYYKLSTIRRKGWPPTKRHDANALA